ncbi:hypothetical protein Tco_0231031 [Tanacetum coccineum]
MQKQFRNLVVKGVVVAVAIAMSLYDGRDDMMGFQIDFFGGVAFQDSGISPCINVVSGCIISYHSDLMVGDDDKELLMYEASSPDSTGMMTLHVGLMQPGFHQLVCGLALHFIELHALLSP